VTLVRQLPLLLVAAGTKAMARRYSQARGGSWSCRAGWSCTTNVRTGKCNTGSMLQATAGTVVGGRARLSHQKTARITAAKITTARATGLVTAAARWIPVDPSTSRRELGAGGCWSLVVVVVSVVVVIVVAEAAWPSLLSRSRAAGTGAVSADPGVADNGGVPWLLPVPGVMADSMCVGGVVVVLDGLITTVPGESQLPVVEGDEDAAEGVP